MKKLVTATLCVAFAIGAFAQSSILNPWSVGINFGGQAGLYPLTAEEGPQIYEPSAFQLNATGMLSDNFGIMAAGNFHIINTENIENASNFVNLQLHAVWNTGNTLNFSSFSENLGLTMHGGIGVAALWQKDRFENPDSRLIKAADEMISLGIGIKPYYAFNENLAVNLDYSFNFTLNQNRDFEMIALQDPAITGRHMTLMLGVSYHFGKSEKE